MTDYKEIITQLESEGAALIERSKQLDRYIDYLKSQIYNTQQRIDSFENDHQFFLENPYPGFDPDIYQEHIKQLKAACDTFKSKHNQMQQEYKEVGRKLFCIKNQSEKFQQLLDFEELNNL